MFSVIVPTLNPKEEWLNRAINSCSFADEIIITKVVPFNFAVNQAVKKASGEWISILPDDDFYLPAIYPIAKAIEDCDADVVHFPCEHWIEEEKQEGIFDVSPNVSFEENSRGNKIFGSSFIRRSVFLELGGYVGGICQDAIFWNNALKQGKKFRYVDVVGAVFRFNSRSKFQKMARGVC